MNYKLTFKKFRSLETVWKAMETPGMSPFLHYDYMRFIKTSVTWFKPFYTRIVCVCPEGSDEILMICPMKLRIDGKYYTLLGDMQGCDIADMLWKQGLSNEEKEAIVRFFFDTMKDKMYLNRIPEDSLLAKSIPSERISYIRDVEYVAVDIPTDFEVFYQTLVYSVRRNAKTHYNRMERDGIECKLHVFDQAHPMDKKMWKKVLDLHITRLLSKYSPGLNGVLGRIYTNIKFRVFKHDTRSLRKLPNTFHAVLMDKEKIMAYMSGFKTHDGETIVIPRLAMDYAYNKYSPGCALMNETIKYLSSGSKVKVLDMSRGDERYKKDFGGRSYFIKDFVVEKA